MPSCRTNRGSWSTGEALPIGVLTAPSYAFVRQVQHNGLRLYELGETRRHAYLLLSGPTDQEHQWTAVVAPGQPFVSVPLSVGIASSVDEAFGVLTTQRRARRALRPADTALPLVFNDYMSTLMGDPGGSGAGVAGRVDQRQELLGGGSSGRSVSASSRWTTTR